MQHTGPYSSDATFHGHLWRDRTRQNSGSIFSRLTRGQAKANLLRTFTNVSCVKKACLTAVASEVIVP